MRWGLLAFVFAMMMIWPELAQKGRPDEAMGSWGLVGMAGIFIVVALALWSDYRTRRKGRQSESAGSTDDGAASWFDIGGHHHGHDGGHDGGGDSSGHH